MLSLAMFYMRMFEFDTDSDNYQYLGMFVLCAVVVPWYNVMMALTVDRYVRFRLFLWMKLVKKSGVYVPTGLFLVCLNYKRSNAIRYMIKEKGPSQTHTVPL